MLQWKHGRTVILLIGILGVLALAAQAFSAKPLRPAATGPSPEAAQLQQFPPAAQQVGRPAKTDLLAQIGRASCRERV